MIACIIEGKATMQREQANDILRTSNKPRINTRVAAGLLVVAAIELTTGCVRTGDSGTSGCKVISRISSSPLVANARYCSGDNGYVLMNASAPTAGVEAADIAMVDCEGGILRAQTKPHPDTRLTIEIVRNDLHKYDSVCEDADQFTLAEARTVFPNG